MTSSLRMASYAANSERKPDSRTLEGKIEPSGAASFWERVVTGGRAFSGSTEGTPFEFRFHGGSDATEGIAKRASGVSGVHLYVYEAISVERSPTPLREVSEAWSRAKDRRIPPCWKTSFSALRRPSMPILREP